MKKEALTRTEVTLSEFITYNLLFFVPLITAVFISNSIARLISGYFDMSVRVASNIIMIFFTIIVFLFIIPYIRKRENIRGVRLALFGFLIVGIVMTIPSMIKGRGVGLLYWFIYLGNYVLLTFIHCPEVLGIDIDLRNWFRHYKQLFVIIVYIAIVVFYVLGFGQIYYEMYLENHNAFSMNENPGTNYGTFLYFSIITFTTIGYGDITPLTAGARLLAGIEAMFGMIINLLFIAILILFISNFQTMIKHKEDAEILREEKEEIELLKKGKKK